MGKLEKYGIQNATENWQWDADKLEKYAVEFEGAVLADSGAISVKTGEFTGRSPKDRFIVKDSLTEDKVWWDGEINLPFDSDKFDALHKKMVDYLEGKNLFVRDGYVCADPEYMVKVRTVNEYAWSNLFAYNMFLRPTAEQLENWGDTDWLILNVPSFKADPAVDGTRQANFSILNFSKKIALVGGSGYTGEMKKGVFSALNFELPTQKNTLSMHCSANVGKDADTAVFFGLSGTGKTTLSADPNRKLIGDDEHGWTAEDKIFNFEGGCYAKVIDLSAEKEPDIFRAIKKGAMLENIVFKEGTSEVDFEDTTITQNTRVSYPINHIDNIQVPSSGENPKNIFFLTYDAFGVLPPISKLTEAQAAYHFISGYTSKVAGTEAGVTEPQVTFSACFGAPFMPLHPTAYAEMLSEKIKKSGANVWLVNTGTNGSGKRMSLKHTRALITAALEGKLDNVEYKKSSFFGVQIPTECEGVPAELLMPSSSWSDRSKFEAKAMKLVEAFKENFKKFESYANEEIMAGGPVK